jgi:DNA polymerase-3 subunit gamma/tau
MSYLVLARKYRPKTFSELVGQSHVVQALSNALTQQRLHHAYLFTGTRGVGKTTVSRILAKSLNCERGITAEPCGACEICLAIDSGRFVDYTELDAASNRGVEEVQQLLEQAVYKPVQGRFKVFMIDEVHMLTNTAFNAMLKTLEEPPEYLKFVLATTDPQKVPVTVLSRCLQFNLRPMAPQTIVEHLSTVLTQEQLSFEPSALSLVSRAAKGSMRDALSLTDQAIAFGGGALVESEVRSMLGNVGQEHVFNLISALAQGSGEQVIAICNQLQDLGLSAVMALEDMAYALQRMACVQFGANTPTTESADLGLDPDHDKLQALAHSMPKDETQLLYNICIRGRSEIPLAPDEYSGLMMVLLRLLAFKDSPKDGSQDSAQQEHLAQAEKKTLTFNASTANTSASSSSAPSNAAHKAPISQEDTPPWEHAIQSGAQAQSPTKSQTLNTQSIESQAPQTSRPQIPNTSAPEGRQLPIKDMAQRAQSASQPLSDAPKGVVSVSVRNASQNPDLGATQKRDAQLPKVQATPEGDFWMALVTSLVEEQRVSSLSRELALQSQLIGRDEGAWLLRIERESLSSANSRERLSQALKAAGHEVVLNFELGQVTDSPALRQAHLALEAQMQAEAKILNDPFVLQLMSQYDAKIIPGSIKSV